MRVAMILSALLLIVLSCNNAPDIVPIEAPVIKPLLVDKEVLSGIGLKQVTNANEPDRELFQQNIFRGNDISVYVVSSETASASHDNYSIDEFIYLVNGSAQISTEGESLQTFSTGDFFVAPKGLKGEWETHGATNYHHELSVISTPRNKEYTQTGDEQAMLLDKSTLSGQGITLQVDSIESYLDQLYEGPELSIVTTSEISNLREIKDPMAEQLVYIISGTLLLTDKSGGNHQFTTGDFVIIPEGFIGHWESRGHRLFRCLTVSKSDF